MAHLVFNAQNKSLGDAIDPGWEEAFVEISYEPQWIYVGLRIPRGNPVISITSNVTNSWLDWSPNSATGPGIQQVWLQATENATHSWAARTAIMTATYQNGQVATMTFRQRGNPGLPLQGNIYDQSALPVGATRKVLDIWHGEYYNPANPVMYGGFKRGQDLYDVIFYDEGDKQVIPAPDYNATGITHIYTSGSDLPTGTTALIATFIAYGRDNGYT